jgi:hypothetical protein
VAVVTPGELDDAVSAGRAAGQAHGAHRRLRAARDKPHLPARRHALADRFGEENLALGRRAVRRAVSSGSLDGFDEAWVGDERATPQPGRFYGGWVTSRIVGPIKGEPGSHGW